MLTQSQVFEALERVKDPEIPVINIVELGMISKIEIWEEKVLVHLTPTFSGCPALHILQKNIVEEVSKLNVEVAVNVDLQTPWSTDKITSSAKQKLENFGLAPPTQIDEQELSLELLDKVRCPHCKSTDTTLRSAFGSTLCRAIRFCFACQQGFEQFKPIK